MVASMSLHQLTAKEKRVVLECLRASVEGPFFPDWEFQTLFGLRRQDVAEIFSRPKLDDADEQVSLVINNAMNNLLGYPHGQGSVWRQFLSVPENEVQRIFDKWKHGRINGVR